MKKENIKTISFFLLGFCLLIILAISLSLLVLHYSSKYGKKEDERVIFYQEGTTNYRVEKKGEDIEVFVEEQVECIKAPCNPISYHFSLAFSKEGKKKASEWIDSLFHGERKITLMKEELSEEEQTLWMAILRNEESFSLEKKLLASIKSARIDCDTVTLKLYDDYTYEYIYRSKNGSLVSRTGTYSLPLSFLEDSRNEIPDMIGPYRISFPSGEEKFLYDNTSSMGQFFTSLGINMDTCLELF